LVRRGGAGSRILNWVAGHNLITIFLTIVFEVATHTPLARSIILLPQTTAIDSFDTDRNP